MICAPFSLFAQVEPPNPGFGNFGSFGNNNNQNNDTFGNKNKKWTNPAPIIHFKHWNSEVKNNVDTSIHNLHQFDSMTVWTYHLGNIGTSTQTFLFQQDNELGPQLHYPQYKPYFYTKESIPFYTTTRPYSLFNYSLGSQQEQVVSLLHTQNVHPRLNLALHIKNLNSPGFFNNLLSVGNGGYFSGNFLSENQTYKSQFGGIYNKIRNDENGGILHDSLLLDTRFVDSRQIPTLITTMPSNRRRSKVTNQYRDVLLFYTQEYRIGNTDTLYNEDSTSFKIQFKPIFSIRHDLDIQLRKHSYEDKIPDRNNYLIFDPSISILPNDTLRQAQHLNTIQNQFTLNGFIGKKIENQFQVEVGLGHKMDFLSEKNKVNNDKQSFQNLYLLGQIRKEALEKNQWSLFATGQFYFAGSSVGDMKFEAAVSKYFQNIGAFRFYFSQNLNTPASNFTNFTTNYFTIKNDFNKISHTAIQAQLFIEHLNLQASFQNHLVYNYIYLDNNSSFQQYDEILNILNLELNQTLRYKKFSLNSRAFVQQVPNQAPIHLPKWGIAETFSYTNEFYSKKLQIHTGIQLKYIGAFQRYDYNFILNQFYFDDENTLSDNAVEIMAFFNFRVKNLRMFVMADQIQQLLIRKNISYVEYYPLPRTMYRFGFKWTLFN